MKHHKTKSPNLNVRPRATKIMTVMAAAMIFATAGFTCIETRIVAPVWDGVQTPQLDFGMSGSYGVARRFSEGGEVNSERPGHPWLSNRIVGDLQYVVWGQESAGEELELLVNDVYWRASDGELYELHGQSPFYPWSPFFAVSGDDIVVPQGSPSGIDVPALATSLGLTYDPSWPDARGLWLPDPNHFPGAHSVRLIDRGACSAVISWDAVGAILRDTFYEELEALIPNFPAEVRSLSVGDKNKLKPRIIVGRMTPVEVDEAGFEFKSRFHLEVDGLGFRRIVVSVINIAIEVRLLADTQQPGALVADVTTTWTVDTDGNDNGVTGIIDSAVRSTVNSSLADDQAISALIEGILDGARSTPLGPLNFNRVIGRPSGIEIVLAETPTSPEYQDLADRYGPGIGPGTAPFAGQTVEISCVRPASNTARRVPLFDGSIELGDPPNWSRY